MDPSLQAIFDLRAAAARNDMRTVKQMMRRDDYTFEMGREAIAIAFTRNNLDIAYELLSHPGSVESLFSDPINMFMVDAGLKASLDKYIKRTRDTTGSYYHDQELLDGSGEPAEEAIEGQTISRKRKTF